MARNSVAIQFEKIIINDDMCIFKPVSVIHGEYDKEYALFISESGLECSYIDFGPLDSEYFYGYPTTIKSLKKRYQITDDDGYTDETVLTMYFNEYSEVYYLGSITPDGIIRTIKIPLSYIEDAIIQNLDQVKQVESYYLLPEENKANDISFNIDSLEKLRDSNSLEEVQAQLNEIIALAKRLGENRLFLQFDEEEIEEQEEMEEQEEIGEQKNSKKVIKKEESKKFNLAKLRKEVLSNIVAQDDAVNRLTTILGVNITSKNPKHKSHILIVGPSGTGKTAMVDVISKYLDIPYFKADATAYTKEGYVGKSVYSMLLGLIEAAGGDIEKAQNGILIIDEIDKKTGGSRGDVAGEAVLTSLLKILDREKIELDMNYYDTQEFDTSNLTIILMGAFSHLYETKLGENTKTQLGFGELQPNKNKSIKITKEDLIKEGMTAEFMGRIDEVIFTKEFTLEDLVEVIYKSKISPLKREKEWFKDMGVTITFSKDFCKGIAEKCLKAKTGAREIKSNIKFSLSAAYDDVLIKNNTKNPKIKQIKLTKETVNDPKKYRVK